MMINYAILGKAVLWRVLATAITAGLAMLMTGDATVALTIGMADTLFKLAAYYAFDVAWEKARKAGKPGKRSKVVWLTGLSGAGKTTIAKVLIKKLRKMEYPCVLLDGDEIRNIFPKTGFDKESRLAHIARVGQMACVLESQGITPVVSLISPYMESREHARSLCQDFMEVHVSTSLEECERRDVKGLYARVRKGEIKNFTGISDPYEAPENPELVLDTANLSLKKSVNRILKEFLK